MPNKLAGLLNRFPTRTLHEATGIYESRLSRWKNSHSLPSPEFFEALAEATGISVKEIAQAVADDKAARMNAKRAAQKPKKAARTNANRAKASKKA